MKNQKVTLRFDEACLSEKYVLNRISGTITADSMIRLIDIADLKANPREAKVGDVTDEIEESLDETPKLFQFKTKGILLAAAGCLPRERSRFELSFEDEDIEGILDGGHNLLAIALHILGKALEEDGKKVLRGVKRWENVPDVWQEHRDKIEGLKSTLEFLTPVEVIYPREGAEGRDEFQDAVLDVARARNNNAQLTEETKANKAGFYNAIREFIDPKLVEQIEWKTNDGGRIKVRDLVALSWIALSKIDVDLPGIADFSPVSMYRNKGACVAAFNKLMASDLVSQKSKGDIRELVHPGVRSAIGMLRDIPQLFDHLYQEFPEAYNAASPGFGRISSVFVYEESKAKSGDPKYLSSPPHTKFYKTECKYDYPDGFVMPLVWALSELMEYREGKVFWKEDPVKFIKKNLAKTLKVYYGLIQMASYDPQKVGKTGASYNLVANDFNSRLK
ncbi:MAG: hypothetical protein WCE73_23240 [Candidatus Angelobacter sp.]